MAVALLRADFIYADVVRWLGGPYTNSHRDWDEVFDALEAVAGVTPPAGCPHVDYDRAYRLATEGAPLAGNFETNFSSVQLRNLRPPSPDLMLDKDAINDKLRKEEQLSCHALLPRFLWRFIYGLHLCLLQFACRYGDPKGRLCIDPSTTLSKADIGNANRHIPPPGTERRHDENPPIFYSTAMQRHLSWTWNLRISYPCEDILQITDDISAAFHRILYHPSLAIVFASVWDKYLVIPVGTIFGSRSSPSTHMVHGELRSHYAQHKPDAHLAAMTDLALRVDIGEDPPLATRQQFAQATSDSQNYGLLNDTGPEPDRRQSSFVDDSGSAHIRRFFRACIDASVAAAYLLFGNPSEDPNRPPCINPTKWIDIATHVMRFLGCIIDTRLMIVIWPLDKRQRMREFIEEVLNNQGNGKMGSSPKEIARVLGLIRHGSFVAPLGIFYTLRLQHLLNDAAATNNSSSRHWWKRHRLVLPPCIIAELQRLYSSPSDDLHHHLWHRPIGLLMPRDPSTITYTDASLNGLGGWSAELNHMWRLSIQDLWNAGFPKGDRHNPQCGESSIDPLLAHINIYEFIAIFIELWICGRQLHIERHLIDGGHRLLALADNTSALSWLRYAARTKRPPVRRLARLLIGKASSRYPEHRSGSAVAIREGAILGIRYQSVLPSAATADLPPAARAVIDSFSSARIGADRGLVRRKNDRTMDNRAARFRSWLRSTAGFRDVHYDLVTVPAAQALLAAFLQELQEKRLHSSGRPHSASSLLAHLNAAHQFFQLATGLIIPLYASGSKRYLPLFQDTVNLTQKWQEPNEKREPFTWEFFEAMAAWVRELTKHDLTVFLDLVPAVFDWVCLGVFTGCRVGEYAQSVAPRGTYSRAPLDAAAGQWQGHATAFVLEDFTFIDARRHILPNTMQTVNHGYRAVEFHLRFRFDKSKINFTIRKFRRGKGFMCPIEAALSILRRALILGISNKEPVGVHRFGDDGHYAYLKSSDVVTTLRKGIVKAHPDPAHFLRVNIKRIVAHSNRVTAAVALKNMGWEDDRIAFRLRWTPESVKHYIRECSSVIGEMTSTSVLGAFII